jgi:hypothetical protein
MPSLAGRELAKLFVSNPQPRCPVCFAPAIPWNCSQMMHFGQHTWAHRPKKVPESRALMTFHVSPPTTTGQVSVSSVLDPRICVCFHAHSQPAVAISITARQGKSHDVYIHTALPYHPSRPLRSSRSHIFRPSSGSSARNLQTTNVETNRPSLRSTSTHGRPVSTGWDRFSPRAPRIPDAAQPSRHSHVRALVKQPCNTSHSRLASSQTHRRLTLETLHDTELSTSYSETSYVTTFPTVFSNHLVQYPFQDLP